MWKNITKKEIEKILGKSETLRLDKRLNKLELKENTFTGKLFSDSGVVTSLEIS